jgi:hypothetical protein
MDIDEIRELARQELKNPLGCYYLSFADDGAGGFLGAAIVEARGPTLAVIRCTCLGINPGGEILIVTVPTPVLPELMDRLLSRVEIAAAFGELAEVATEITGDDLAAQ